MNWLQLIMRMVTRFLEEVSDGVSVIGLNPPVYTLYFSAVIKSGKNALCGQCVGTARFYGILWDFC